jgi:transmembrane sensor
MEKNQNKMSHEDLIYGYLKGELTAGEIAELINWISLDKANKRYFDKCSELWITYKSVTANTGFNAQEGFWKFRQRIRATDNLPESVHKRRTILLKTVLKYAAVFVIAFALGGMLFFYGVKKSTAKTVQSINEIVVPLGSKAELSLSDGTVVTLNAGSTIKVDPFYGVLNRTIELEGEGYFKVAKDEKNPFIVKTTYLKVIALGTEFNIKAYTLDRTIETTLVTGSVKIEPASSDGKGEVTILKPSEKLTFFKTDSRSEQESTGREQEMSDLKPVKVDSRTVSPRPVKENVNIEPVVSWKEDRWIFEQESLAQIAVDLERKFNVRIVFESERLKSYRFTGKILAEPIEQVLEVMSISAPISFRLKGNIVNLSENENFYKVNKDLYTKP